MSLTDKFCNVVRFQLFHRWMERLCVRPASKLENAYGISGISQKYKLPEGRSSTSIENDYLDMDKRTTCDITLAVLCFYNIERIKSLLQKAWQGVLKEECWKEKMKHDVQQLIYLNPMLNEIQLDLDDTNDMLDLIFGVTSGFNIDDIQYYIKALDHHL